MGPHLPISVQPLCANYIWRAELVTFYRGTLPQCNTHALECNPTDFSSLDIL